MKKPTLLYASPFPPQQSGISDYSVLLVNALKDLFDCTLLTDNYAITDSALDEYPVLKFGKDEIDYDSFDYRIYNIGNNMDFHEHIYEAALAHPGMVILHDYVIWGLFNGYYTAKKTLFSSVYSKNGLDEFMTMKHFAKAEGLSALTQLEMMTEMPLNREIIESGNKIMVHSQYALNKILKRNIIDEKMVRQIKLIEQIDDNDYVLVPKEKLYKKYHIPLDAVLISSFGYVQETKLNREACQAMKKIKDKTGQKICYVMVGKGDYVNELLEPDYIIKTGYTELEEFNSFIEYSDIILNMRYPSMGETSAAMLRTLQLGKVSITNNGGWFSELPDDCVCKVELENVVDNIADKIIELLDDPAKRKRMEENARRYAKEEHKAEKIAREIFEFISE